MPRKKTCQSLPQNTAHALLVLLLSIGGGMVLPHKARAQDSSAELSSPPEGGHQVLQTPLGTPVDVKGMEQEYGPDWKNVLANHEKRKAEFEQRQQARLKAAQLVTASGEQNMDDLVKLYPFLKDDFQNVKDMQQKVTDYANKNLDHSIDVSPHLQTAESRDKINVLFVSKSGKLWCGAHGCMVDIYVDDGTGYQKANQFIVSGDMRLSRTDGQISLFFDGTTRQKASEWLLEGHTFVKLNPPED